MSTKIQVRRGLKLDLPKLSTGELGLCTDTEQLYVGAGDKNLEVLTTNSPTMSFKNKIINGNFDVWQRGTSFIAAAINITYTADRFYIPNTTRGNTTVKLEKMPSTSPVKGATNYLHYAITEPATIDYKRPYFVQRIENPQYFSGKKVTVSFWAKCDVATSMGVDINIIDYGETTWRQINATPINIKSSANAVEIYETETTVHDGLNFTVDASWKKYSFTFQVPVLDMGNSPRNYMAFALWPPEKKETSFCVAQIQLEEGEVATEFEQRPIQIEELLCKRYFEKIMAKTLVSDGFAGHHMRTHTFVAAKRVAPTIRFTKGWIFTSASGSSKLEINAENENMVVASIGTNGSTIGVSIAAPANFGYELNFNFDAEI